MLSISIAVSLAIVSIFLYYGIFTLKHILPNELYYNFFLLTRSISLLNKRRVSPQDIFEAEKNIQDFIKQLNDLYPVTMHRYNVHMLLHLPKVVQRFGPLFLSSSFSVENEIGKILKHVQMYSSRLCKKQQSNSPLKQKLLLYICT